MMDTVEDEVEQFVIDNQPVDQDIVTKEFGRRGLVALKTLYNRGKVSHSVEWDIIHEEVDYDEG